MRRLGRAVRFRFRALGVEPLLRLLWCGAAIALGRLLDPRGGGPRQDREAQRVSATLGTLKGPFAKLGQFASLRIDVLPAAFRERLALLCDRVPPVPFAWMRDVVERELGARLEERFVRFDARPLGTASIGQVHRARLHDGREVAVKVQYPWLVFSLTADLGLLRWCLRFAGGPRGPQGRRRDLRLFEEFASGVREELDFRREALVAAEIAQNLAEDDQVVVPQVIASHSTGRVLTMEYFEALPVSDRQALARCGIPASEVLEILARAYAKQVFVDGLFHADPHPGNLFVLDGSPGSRRPRVLFVDFGLSKRLAPELRRALREGIYAMLQADLEGFVSVMRRMDMIAPQAEPAARRAVESMFQRLRAEAQGPLGMGGDRVLALKDEAKALLEGIEGVQLPNDLLLYAKTFAYVFALGRELAPEVDLMKLSVPYLLRFLATPDAA